MSNKGDRVISGTYRSSYPKLRFVVYLTKIQSMLTSFQKVRKNNQVGAVLIEQVLVMPMIFAIMFGTYYVIVKPVTNKYRLNEVTQAAIPRATQGPSPFHYVDLVAELKAVAVLKNIVLDDSKSTVCPQIKRNCKCTFSYIESMKDTPTLDTEECLIKRDQTYFHVTIVDHNQVAFSTLGYKAF
jgi:hypothetical protein